MTGRTFSLLSLKTYTGAHIVVTVMMILLMAIIVTKTRMMKHYCSVGCLTSHAACKLCLRDRSADMFMCCHSETEVEDQICCFTQSQCTDICPTTDLTMPDS